VTVILAASDGYNTSEERKGELGFRAQTRIGRSRWVGAIRMVVIRRDRSQHGTKRSRQKQAVRKVALHAAEPDGPRHRCPRSIFQACRDIPPWFQENDSLQRGPPWCGHDYQTAKNGYDVFLTILSLTCTAWKKVRRGRNRAAVRFEQCLDGRKLCFMQKCLQAASFVFFKLRESQSDLLRRNKYGMDKSVASMALRRECGFSSLSTALSKSIRSPEEHYP